MPIHILITDDDPASLLALSEAVQVRLGEAVIVDTASDTAAALRYLTLKRYDIALCDVRMPGRDGIALLQEISSRWPSVRVIMITGGLEKEEQALFSGAYAFLHKPVEIDHLITVMEAAVGCHAASPTAEAPTRRTKHLLIVGNDGITTALRNDVELQLPDVEASIADNGSSALLMLAAHEYDAVLADACMPGLNGFALVAELRILRPETPVVLISGSDEPGLKRRAREAGAYTFISKSSAPEQVIGTVRQALQHGELARRVRELNRQEFLSAVNGTSFAVGGFSAMRRLRELNDTLKGRISELTKSNPTSQDPPGNSEPIRP